MPYEMYRNYTDSYPCEYGPYVEESDSTEPPSSEEYEDYDEPQPQWDPSQPEWDQSQPRWDQPNPQWDQPQPQWDQPHGPHPQWNQPHPQWRQRPPQWGQQRAQPQWNYQQDRSWRPQQTYNDTLYRNTQCPFYATMGQPMVYYQCNGNRKSTNQQRARNPNCFVKAFRWYTQDHLPVVPDKQKMSDLGIAGFASWLDDKYEQYLRENQRELSLKDTQTSGIKTETVTLETVVNPCCPCPPNSIKRTRSQTISAHMQSGDTECGCGTEHIESTQFILPPKDLSRPVSDSDCMQTPPISCCSEGHMNKKIMIKSQSTTNVCDNCDTKTRIDIVKTQEGINSIKQSKQKVPAKNKKSSVISCECSTTTKSEAQSSTTHTQCEPSNVTWLEAPCSTYCPNSRHITPSSSQKTSKLGCSGSTSMATTITNQAIASEKTSVVTTKSTRIKSKESVICDNVTVCEKPAVCDKHKNKACECMAEFVAEMSTQYSQECCLQCYCPTCHRDGVWTCQNNDKGGRIPGPPAVKQTSNNPSKTNSCTRPCCPNPSKCSNSPNNAPIAISQCPNPRKCSRPPPIATSQQCSKRDFVVSDAQTSDYAITLEENTFGRCYPLFMKIVCADKLCNDTKCGSITRQ